MKILRTFNTEGRTMAEAECAACGAVVTRQVGNAKRQKTCGCNRLPGPTNCASKHGREPRALYFAWGSMKERCRNPKNKRWERYGGRGISVCAAWSDSFAAFREWALRNGWKKGLEIDRKDNNGNYTPSNCRITTKAINGQNRGDNKLTQHLASEIRTKALSDGANCAEIGREYGVTRALVRRIRDNKCWRCGGLGYEVKKVSEEQ